MISFCIALAVLIGGYFLYGGFVTRIFKADPNRPTPVQTMADGVDYVELPTWKIFLIQFLNIAGLGPIFGAIMGVMYGPAAFLWIVFGTILGGAVHDYFSGMLSLRRNGISIPEIIGKELGKKIKMTVRVLSLFLMVLVGAVFVFNPADLLSMLTPESMDRTFWIWVIFAYYMAATMLPIDKLIGKLYPVFGFALLFMALGIMVMLFAHAGDMPEIWSQFYNHKPNPEANPIFPMMFVSIACGAISGFHATQSPMMARCLRNEKHGRIVFYGAMVTEGIVALIWAAGAVTFTRGYQGLQEFMSGASPAVLVNDLSVGWLGAVGGVLAVLGVVAAPISTGDTALRSARLIASDMLGVKQKKIANRFSIAIPIFALTFLVMMIPYEALWRYFAWCNQTLAVFTLWAITVWLARERKPYWVTMIPAMFMTVVTVSYIFFAPEGLGLITDPLIGYRFSYELSVGLGLVAAAICTYQFGRFLNRRPAPVPVREKAEERV
ncbi:MAG: carbon starvation protein A [Bacteroidales bacterium]|nr:carbon starvation protein A [Bacteroidales bacterium]